jgi:hypothetical protein
MPVPTEPDSAFESAQVFVDDMITLASSVTGANPKKIAQLADQLAPPQLNSQNVFALANTDDILKLSVARFNHIMTKTFVVLAEAGPLRTGHNFVFGGTRGYKPFNPKEMKHGDSIEIMLNVQNTIHSGVTVQHHHLLLSYRGTCVFNEANLEACNDKKQIDNQSVQPFPTQTESGMYETGMHLLAQVQFFESGLGFPENAAYHNANSVWWYNWIDKVFIGFIIILMNLCYTWTYTRWSIDFLLAITHAGISCGLLLYFLKTATGSTVAEHTMQYHISLLNMWILCVSLFVFVYTMIDSKTTALDLQTPSNNDPQKPPAAPCNFIKSLQCSAGMDFPKLPERDSPPVRKV